MESYHELCAWSLSLRDADFVHQHVVDAHAAQTAEPDDKPIRLAFALVGLCLHLEHGFTGRAVQRAHVAMGRRGGPWPTFELPAERGGLTAADVLEAPPDDARLAALEAWASSVWAAFAAARPAIETLLREHRVLPPLAR